VFLWSEKLPFAGYSIVKECLKLSSYQPDGCQPVERPTSHRSDFALRLRRTSRCLSRRASLNPFRLTTAGRLPAADYPCVRTSYSTIRARPMQARPQLSCQLGGWPANRSSFAYALCPPSPRLRRATSACIHEQRLENTGLEPVTSWLQTRRSPS
jgi:hypothetical protein